MKSARILYLGKAVGVCGAFVAGSTALIEGLVQFARTYVYTTALPPALAAATAAAVDIARYEHWRRDRLHTLVAQDVVIHETFDLFFLCRRQRLEMREVETQIRRSDN